MFWKENSLMNRLSFVLLAEMFIVLLVVMVSEANNFDEELNCR